MHVRPRAPSRPRGLGAPLCTAGAVSALAALCALGCDRSSNDEARASASTTPSSAPSPAPPAADDPKFVAAARRAREAAGALVSTCRTTYGSPEESLMLTDVCKWSREEEAALLDAWSALRAQLAGGALRGACATFVDELRLFAEWVILVHDLPKRGTLAHYQELALAWNAWRTSEPVAVDPVAPSYPVWSRFDAGTASGDAGHLRWDRCGSGACLKLETR